jgi:hypothetical protein
MTRPRKTGGYGAGGGGFFGIAPGHILVAWDYSSRHVGAIGVYDIGPGGARYVAGDTVAASRRASFEADLRRRGVRIGCTYASNEFVWVTDDLGFAVWSLSDVRAESTLTGIRASGKVFARSAVAAIVSFLAPGDLGHRGVAAELGDGSTVVLVDERDAAADLDPTYNIEDVMIDAAWATYLGRDLAANLNVPHRDQLP